MVVWRRRRDVTATGERFACVVATVCCYPQPLSVRYSAMMLGGVRRNTDEGQFTGTIDATPAYIVGAWTCAAGNAVQARIAARPPFRPFAFNKRWVITGAYGRFQASNAPCQAS